MVRDKAINWYLMLNRKIIFLSWVCCMGCISDVPEFNIDTESKVLIIGYIGTHGEKTKVKVLRSVGINKSGRDQEVVRNAKVKLIATDQNGVSTEYPLFLVEDQYQTAHSLNAEPGFEYSLEVGLDKKIYQSDALTLPIQSPRVNFEEVASSFQDFRRWKIMVKDASDYYSYFINLASFKDDFDFFETLQSEKYFDKTYRNRDLLTEDVEYSHLPGEPFITTYVIQIPHEVDYFFREWSTQSSGNQDGSFFLDLAFSVPPGNLKSNFKNEDQKIPPEIIGVFFPAHTYTFK